MQFDRLAHGVAHPPGVRILEVDAAGHRAVDVVDAVGQAADPAYQRNRAIALAVHLVEAARLVARGHDEEVAGGFDAVGKPFVVGQTHGDATRMARSQLRKSTFKALIA